MFVVENQRSGQEIWEPVLASLVALHGTCGQSSPLCLGFFVFLTRFIVLLFKHILSFNFVQDSVLALKGIKWQGNFRPEGSANMAKDQTVWK